MDVEVGSNSGEEVGLNIEAGKRRKVVRKGRFHAGAFSRGFGSEDLFQALKPLSNSDKERCRNILNGSDVEVGISEAVSEVSEFGGDKIEFNALAATAPTQEDVANTPCG